MSKAFLGAFRAGSRSVQSCLIFSQLHFIFMLKRVTPVHPGKILHMMPEFMPDDLPEPFFQKFLVRAAVRPAERSVIDRYLIAVL